MHIISRPKITEAQRKFPDAEKWLDAWWVLASQVRWQKINDVWELYPSADQVGRCLIFDVCGNRYRFIVKVSYSNKWSQGTLFVKHFLTHAEYDKEKWKKDCGC